MWLVISYNETSIGKFKITTILKDKFEIQFQITNFVRLSQFPCVILQGRKEGTACALMGCT